MPQFNQSLENGAKIISLFTQVRPSWRISEISEALNFTKTTSFNLVSTLEKIGYLYKNKETQKYELGIRLASIGSIMVTTMELNQKGAGVVQELASTYGLSCRMGVWDRDSVLVIFNGYPTNVAQPPSYQAGPRVAAFSTAMGRAMLSCMATNEVKSYLNRVSLLKFTAKTKIEKKDILKEIAETQKRGYAICNEEMVYGHSSIGAPIVNGYGKMIGAMSFVGETEKVLGPEKENNANAIRRKAQQISATLGYGE